MRVLMPGPWNPDEAVEKRRAEEEKEFRDYGLWGGPAPMETVFSDVVDNDCVAERWSQHGSGHAAVRSKAEDV